jgi:bacterioferritin-associated ferredoxin
VIVESPEFIHGEYVKKMAENKIICTKNNIDYITIRKAMCVGARTVDEVVEKAGVCAICEGCKAELGKILASVCGCMEVSLKEVVDAVKNGADTVEKVAQITKAGTGDGCGRCKVLIENIIELGR